MTKKCLCCHEEKLLNAFCNVRWSQDGRNTRCKACCRESNRRYHAANREAEKARHAAYLDANRDTINARKRSHYAENASQISATRSVRRIERGHEMLAKERVRYVANIELYRSFSRDWNKRNPEYVSSRKIERKRAIRRAPGRHTPAEFRALVEAYGGKCLCCGVADGPRQSATEIVRDHIVPISKGGSNAISNIQPLCRACNTRKRDGIIDYRPRMDAA